MAQSGPRLTETEVAGLDDSGREKALITERILGRTATASIRSGFISVALSPSAEAGVTGAGPCVA